MCRPLAVSDGSTEDGLETKSDQADARHGREVYSWRHGGGGDYVYCLMGLGIVYSEVWKVGYLGYRGQSIIVELVRGRSVRCCPVVSVADFEGSSVTCRCQKLSSCRPSRPGGSGVCS